MAHILAGGVYDYSGKLGQPSGYSEKLQPECKLTILEIEPA